MASTGNLATSGKLLGYEMKCDTYDPDSPKVGNELFSSFATDLNNLSKLSPYSLMIVLLLSMNVEF